MADLHPNEFPFPFQEVPRYFIHVQELDVLIKYTSKALTELERLRRCSLQSNRKVPVGRKYYFPPEEQG